MPGIQENGMTKELTIIRTLQNHGRALARDIAKAAGVDNADAIKALVVLEHEGRVAQLNGYWWLVCDPAPAPVPAQGKRTRGRKSA